jgi:hypothetical protein
MWQIPAAKEPPSTHKTFTFAIAVVGLACRPPLWGFTKPPENRRIWIEVSRDGRAGHAEGEAKSEPDTDANVEADQNLESGVSDGD